MMPSSRYLENWAVSRETSIEIAEAIHELACSRVTEVPCLAAVAEDIWAAPTREDETDIIAMAFARCLDDVLTWGATDYRRNAD